MKKILIIMLLVIGFVSGCGVAPEKNVQEKILPPKITTKHCRLRPFKSIKVNGHAQVELVNGKYAMNIKGVNANHYDCQHSVVHHVLYLKDLVSAKVSTMCLRGITVTDNAKVCARNLKTDKLRVTAKDYAAINLNGYYNVENISQYGNGRIDIGWVRSNNLMISSDNSGPINLAGEANRMFVKLLDDATLNARYLRSYQATVIAADNALAEVTVLNSLKALAIDNSNIFYYQRPKHLTVVTRDSGNVLQFDWIR